MAAQKIRIANYILAIIKSNSAVMYSWGFNKPVVLSNNLGLRFHVNGFKHRGFVKVMYHRGKDLFFVIFLNENKEEISRVEDVAFDCLVDTIDRAVAKTEDYMEKIRMN